MVDVSAGLATSRRFFAGHGLADWAEALPTAPALGDADRTALARAEKQGFTAGFAFPAFALQVASLDRVIGETLRKPAPVPDNQQYREPFLADTWTRTPNGKLLQRQEDLGPREWGAYFLLFSPDPLPKFWGLTGKQMREQLEAKDWRGLTVTEYLVLQRFLCEKHGDHRFFANPENESGAHSIWLLDSMDDKNCAVAMGKSGTINIQATSVGNRDRNRAAVGGIVLSL